MKWLITGDWQCRFSNLKECAQAHTQELSILDNYKIDGHIDVGDLKDEYSPVAVEVIEFQFKRTKNIQEKIDPHYTIKLGGNHDRVGQHSEDRNWLHLFKYLGGHVIIGPEILMLDNTIVFGLPFVQDPDTFLDNAAYLAHRVEKLREDTRKKILLFHQDIKNARYSKLRQRKSDSKITVESLRPDRYDQVFGGHVHLRQKLAENVQYVGSPFAIDWGEIDQRKGFTVYDDKTDKIDFVESVVPGRYSYTYLQGHSIEKVPDGTQIKDTPLCESEKSNYTQLIESKIREISKLYPNAVIQVTPKLKTVDGSIKEVSGLASEKEQLRLYIRSSMPVDLKRHKRKTIAFLQSILEQTLGRRVRITDKIIFEDVEASNVLSFKHVSLDYKNRGIVCVIGKNNSGGVLSSNGAGKTNLLSLLCVALQGKTFKGQQHDKWANRSKSGPALVSLNLRTSKKEKITIVRGRRPAKLQVLINDKDASEGMRQNDVQKQIEELTGFTYDTLANSVYIDQTLSNAFISGTDKTRAELIARFQNLDKYDIAREYASQALKRLKEIETETMYQLRLLKESLEEKQRDLKDEALEFSSKKNKLNKEFAKAVKELESFQSANAKRKDKIDIILPKCRSMQSSLRDKKEEENALRYAAQSVIRDCEDQLKHLRNISEEERCPVCFRRLDGSTLGDMTAPVVKKLDAHKEKLKRAKMSLANLDKEQQELDREIGNLEHRLSLYNKGVSEFERSIDYIKHEIALVDKEERYKKKLQVKIRRVAQLKKKIKVSKRYLQDLVGQKHIVEYAVDTFSRKGFPAFLSRLVCPLLNKSSEYYSDLFLDGEIKVIFEVENDAITPKIININGDKEIEGQSTGEKAWAGIISSFALRSIAQPSNLLILDEPGHGLDAVGAKRFGEKVCQLEKMFDTILITTHNSHLQAALDNTTLLEVVKDRKTSRLLR